MERVQNAAQRMQTLINDLLTFSRVTTKAQPFAPVDLAELVQEVVADLEARIERTGGRVEIGSLPIIDADPLQIRQLFQNLIGNGLKFHKEEEAPIVKVYTKSLNGTCQILVQDNGIGFDEKYLDRIFAIFQRLHGRLEYEGTGIGLAVCRRIAERHGGSITAKSTPGQGATFIVALPTNQSRGESCNENIK
jgi:light-regulated signal transduction histidine kinase (bacteriophytochrome)